MILDIKFIFCGYKKLWENHEFEKIIVFMLKIMWKTFKEMHQTFINKKNHADNKKIRNKIPIYNFLR
jgi:hypothetical protein